MEAYSDDLFQNANLLRQVQERLALLIKDSVGLASDNTAANREDFLFELKVISERFKNTRKFRLGIGLSYTYPPAFSYKRSQPVDLSAFFPFEGGGSGRLDYTVSFANESYPSFIISARMPPIQVDASIPAFETTKEFETPVSAIRAPSNGQEVLARSSVTSRLRVDYDVSARISIPGLCRKMRDDKEEKKGQGNSESVTTAAFVKKPVAALSGKGIDSLRMSEISSSRIDFGVGAGVTGFRVADDVATEVRHREDATVPYADLPAGITVESHHSSSYYQPFLLLYFALDVSDEFRVSVDAREHSILNFGQDSLVAKGVTMSISATWYPTFLAAH